MKKIWFFGDSFTLGGCRDGFDSSQNFSVLLGNHYGMEIFNGGGGGFSNLDILKTTTKYLRHIRPGDKVVIGMTDPYRILAPRLIKDGNHAKNIHLDLLYDEYKDYTYGLAVRGDVPSSNLKYLDTLEEDLGISAQGYSSFVIDKALAEFNAYYIDWIKSIVRLLQSQDVETIQWNQAVYRCMSDEYYCSCSHWNEKGTNWFAKVVIWAFNNKVDFLEPSFMKEKMPKKLADPIVLEKINYKKRYII